MRRFVSTSDTVPEVWLAIKRRVASAESASAIGERCSSSCAAEASGLGPGASPASTIVPGPSIATPSPITLISRMAAWDDGPIILMENTPDDSIDQSIDPYSVGRFAPFSN